MVRRPRRWAELDRVERVDLYTRHSLHVVLWLFCGALLLSVTSQPVGGGRRLLVLGGGVVVTALASVAMGAVVSGWPTRSPLPRLRLGALAVAAGTYYAAVGLTAEGDTRGIVTTVVVGALCAAFGGLPDHRVAVGVLVLSGLLCGLSGGSLVGVLVGAGLGALVVASVRLSLWLLGVVSELDGARLAQAQLAVAQERLRFSRDVHDVLGRRLSTIAVQAELAATLAARGDDRAAQRMLEVRGVAHDALAEVRELARGYRPPDLPHEVEGARSLLHSAGIDVELDLDVVPRAWHEAAAWVVRESVTNVLRHSDAGQVRIAYRDGELRVDNDGVRAAPDRPADGSGLEGVRERLQTVGASLRTHRDGERWSVVARLPGAGPVTATTRAPTRARDTAP